MQHRIVNADGSLLLPVPPHELFRLQKAYFTSATLRAMHPNNAGDAAQDYFRAIELVIAPPSPYPSEGAHTLRELIVATFVAGYLIQTVTDGPVPETILEGIGEPVGTTLASLAENGFDIFRTVRTSGDRLIQALTSVGDNALPFLLLLPEHVARLPAMLFQASKGVLPAICSPSEDAADLRPPHESVVRQTNLMTSTILLALAKRYQDHPSSDVIIPGFDDSLNVNHSLAILFYYLALSLNPSPSTYNNMGIILSTTSSTTTYMPSHGERLPLNGVTLARIYYSAGLQADPAHPHLLTNLGSLYKDQGNLDEAIR